MFTKADFTIFETEGLTERMAEIRSQIQPKFQQLDEYFVSELSPLLQQELPIHIAQHRRRTAYAPDNTWSAIGGDKRGYKKYPHFQLAINGEFIAMWLSFIDNPVGEQAMANEFLDNIELFDKLPRDFVISPDHTVNTIVEIATADLEGILTRWRDVKKGEFQIGRVIEKESKLLDDPEAARGYMLETYLELVPLYQLAMKTK